MRSAYQSADHPDRMRLVFTSLLHQQLQTLARGRELHAPPPPPPQLHYMRHANGHGNGHGSPYSRPRELNGWELEKKVVVLKEVRALLEVPCFLYAEQGESANGSSVASFFSMESYFSKTLPLVVGQHSLLDVWEYLLDMCEYVPVRNRTRSLYLHAIACIGRRVEFIRGYVVDTQTITVDDTVQDRYYELLRRGLALCNAKLTQSRIVLEENALFMVHVFTTLCMRFPHRAGRVFDALVEATRVLEDAGGARVPHERRERSWSEPLTVGTSHHSGGPAVLQRADRERGQCRSPRDTQRNWNGLSDYVRRNSEMRSDERVKGVLHAFSQYKQTRRDPAGAGTRDRHHSTTTTTVFPRRRTVEWSLCQALESDMKPGEPISPQEVAFLRNVPILHVFSGTERTLLARYEALAQELELGLNLFTERLQKPARDDVLLVYFIGAYLSDHSYWCDAAFACSNMTVEDAPMLWHCVPGYFCVVRAFVAMFKKMGQRRPRMTGTTPATVGNILSIVQGQNVDVWSSYWTTREVNSVLDTLSEVAKNTRLVNTFVEIVLEGTNILDPASVNYGLSILQRVLETAASAALGSRHLRGALVDEGHDYNKKKRAGSRLSSNYRGSLDSAFDDVYFCTALRKALLSSHVQILLKALTFLYSCLDLLPSRGRRLIISELVIRENFFRLFLHWNEEIRKIYCYIIVFKVFASSRLDLPCTGDQVLLSRSPFFHAHESGSTNSHHHHHSHHQSSGLFSGSSASSPSFGYWSHFSDMAQSILKSPSAKAKEEQRQAVIANGLANLIAWDAHGATIASSGSASRVHRRVSLFRASLDDDDISVDLLVASKLDASLKMLADQVGRKKTSASDYFPVEQEAYAERALSQYVHVLWEYYAAAFDRPSTKPPAPKLEFTITSPFAAE